MDKSADDTSTCNRRRNRLKKAIWFAAGTVCVALGAVGTVLPLLPTTPFLLAAAACYCKSSERAYRWLLTNKWFGEYIRNYKEGKGIPKKTKITALSLLWATIGFSTVFALPRLLPETLVLPMQLAMSAVAVAISVHILKLPTFKKT
ncbi:MAG: YbaN family protein [Candidatus Bathyarchaeales archaeon]